MFDLRMLGYFIAAYEERSITGAARRCYIAQPSITSAILKLEGILEVQLFKRTKKGLITTSEGDRLYQRAKNFMAESEAIVKEFRSSPHKEIRLHVQEDLILKQAAPIIKLLYNQIPGLILKLTPANEKCEIKLISDHCRKKNDFFTSLWEEAYIVIIPANHPLRFKMKLELKDLHNCAFIDRPKCLMAKTFLDLLRKNKVMPDIRAESESEEALVRLVQLGIGIAIVPESHANNLEGVVIRPMKEITGVKRKMGLACSSEDQESIKLIRQLKKQLE